MAPLRWGIVGCGNISGTFVTALSCAPDRHRVSVLGASSLERAEGFKAKFGLDKAKAVGSYDQVFAAPEVDVVYVGNQNHQHLETVLAALAGGKDVLCEKPLGVNEAEVRQMVAAAKAADRLLMEGFWSRCFPVYRRIREELSSGSIGTPIAVTTSFGFAFGDGLLRPEICGSTLLYLGCYSIQFALLVFGRGPVTVLSAHAEKTETGMDRHVSMALQWPCGGIAQIMISTKVQLANDAAIFGQKGKLRIPELMWCPNRLELPSGEVLEIGLPPGPPTSHKDEMGGFGNRIGFLYEADAVADALSKGLKEAPEVTHEDSIAVAQIMDQVRAHIGLRFPKEDA